ncbi:malate:quinone oxidoreductase [Schumannella soli]|uniref:Probable malate:quinone oxidoreductase n=1 Tax=Schumannella soli TaxID=2590779 RepID=A0A506YA47_9MICO|nr:malate:quinone oxidoreductase [Schumannella soli]TPW77329.1 malate:quinone oxidoreductase [Schumannella soli]
MSKPIDVALIGGGIMSATLGTLLQRLEPGWSISIFESLGDIAQESSNPWNNAGTGHSALCELNYTPEKNGQIDVSKAIEVNEQFQVSRQFWSYLVDEGALPDPKAFINEVPHMSFVWGEKNVDYLRRRFEALKDHPLFAGMEYSEDAKVIRSWAPLLIPGRRKDLPIAATRIAAGTDVDFGALTRLLVGTMTDKGAKLKTDHRVIGLKRTKDGLWKIRIRHEIGGTVLEVTARFVFVGAGGGALNLLQKSGIPEIKGFGGFPISGEFLRTDNPEVVAQHAAKVYGKASVGAPPMSVPHLDTRVVNGQASLLFGPYAGFSTKYLKKGSLLDLFQALRPHNISTFLGAGLKNLDLVKYLVGEVFASRAKKIRALQEFAPNAKGSDWRLITAGQRVQVMKKDANGKAVIQFGTEVVSAADGSIAGLLGASPGASTAVPIMLTLAEKCFPDKIAEWTPKLTEMVPSYGATVGADEKVAAATLERTAAALQIQR